MKSEMTLEQVRDELRRLASDGGFSLMADAIDAHLTQSAEASEPVATIRHTTYSGVARNGAYMEVIVLDGSPYMPEGTLLYTASNAMTTSMAEHGKKSYDRGFADGRTTPEGFVLVPVEPTVEMLVAGRKQTVADIRGDYMGPSAENTYKAMLSAAPKSVGG